MIISKQKQLEKVVYAPFLTSSNVDIFVKEYSYFITWLVHN